MYPKVFIRAVSGELAKVYFVNFNDGLTGIILKESLHGYKLKKV